MLRTTNPSTACGKRSCPPPSSGCLPSWPGWTTCWTTGVLGTVPGPLRPRHRPTAIPAGGRPV